MKKLAIFLVILFSFFFIKFDNVKAYEFTYNAITFNKTLTFEIDDNMPYFYLYEMSSNVFVIASPQPFVGNYSNRTYLSNDSNSFKIYRAKSNVNPYLWLTNTNGRAEGFTLAGCTTKSNCQSLFNTYHGQSNHDIYNYNTSELWITNTLIPDPTFDYEITEGTERGKKLTLYFNNYASTDYAVITNFQTGISETIEDLSTNNTKIYDNINQDNNYQIIVYNENNEIILTRSIDVQEQLYLTDERYILIASLNVLYPNSYALAFFNTKTNDKCYYKKLNENEIEVPCTNTSTIIDSTNKNTYIENYIKDKNGNIVVKKNVNLNYLANLPYFNFESTFDSEYQKQILQITTNNFQNGDIIYYSYDKENWYTLPTQRINYLDFYNSTDIYFKLERNSEVITEAYFDLVYNSYSNSTNNNDLSNSTNFSFKNLLNSFKQFANNNQTLTLGVNVYNQLKNSKIGLYLTIIITGSLIILVVKAIKR